MELKRLGNVIKIISGSPFDSKFFNENKEGMPLIRVRDVNSGFAGIYYSGKYEDTFIINDGDLLIGLDGDFKCVEWKYGKALLNQRVCKLIPIEGLVSREYILHFLPQALNEIHRNTNYTTVKHLSTKTINEIEIPLPRLSEQIRIAEILNLAESLISQRKQGINLLDQLLKSTFLNMFGDPVRNEKKWEIKTIEQLVKKGKQSIKRGPFGGALKKEIFIEKGFLVYEQFHALNNDFTFERYYISDEKFEELKAFEVFPDDIIISCSGVYLGKLAIIPKNAKRGIINQALLKISLDQKIINNKFFVFLFRHESFKNRFFGDVRGSGVPNFPPMPEFKKFQFIYPSIELQNKFVNIVEKVEALKTQYQQSLTELQNMYGVLSQKAFKGELNVKEAKIKEKV